MLALTATPGVPVDRDTLFRTIGRQTRDAEDRRLDILISRLRAKFKGASAPLPVKAVRGVGYVFPQPVQRRNG